MTTKLGKVLQAILPSPAPQPYVNTRLEYAPGEVPPYAFCEPVWVATAAPWCIRPINPETGLKLSGGVDTTSFCGRVRPSSTPGGGGGWDLRVRITEDHLESPHCCKKCLAAYREALKK